MAIWFFQIVASEVRIVDFVQGHAIGIPGFAKIIREEKNIRGGIDYVPHDARVTELGTEKTRLETMIACKLNPSIVASMGVEDGINAGRRVLPRCWFLDIPSVGEGLEGLAHYRAEWDQDKKTFKDAPFKDFSAHVGDAFRYLAASVEEVTITKPVRQPGVLYTKQHDGEELPPNQVTLDDLWKLNQRDTNPMGY